jgi:hypothetical protein
MIVSAQNKLVSVSHHRHHRHYRRIILVSVVILILLCVDIFSNTRTLHEKFPIPSAFAGTLEFKGDTIVVKGVRTNNTVINIRNSRNIRDNETFLHQLDGGAETIEILPANESSPSLGGFQANINQTKLLYVHVGKTGGITLDMALRSNCLWHRSAKARTKCLQALELDGSESMVSQKTILTLHCFTRNDFERTMKRVNGFLVTIRNPITRAVSAFNVGHPDNKSTGLNGKKTLPTPVQHFYVDCFPTIEHLAMNLQKKDEGNMNSTNKSLEQTCYELGVKTLGGSGEINAAGHLLLNYAHYDRLVNFTGRDILVVRTEHLWDDLSGVDRLLGGSGYFSHAGEARTHQSEMHSIRQGLSVRGEHTICCYLISELQLYEDLLRQALNLSPAEKESTMSTVYDQCGIDTETRRNMKQNPYGSFLWVKWAGSSPTCPSQLGV